MFETIGILVLGFALGVLVTYFFRKATRYDGSIDIVETEDKISFVLNVDGDPNDIPSMKELIFKVNGAPQTVLREENSD